MVKPENQIIISLSDLMQAIKRQRFTIAYIALGFFFLASIQALKKPLFYKAEGFLKNKNKESTNISSKLFSNIATGDSNYSGNDDPKDFLSSYPVTERVVKRFHLQGHISESKTTTARHPIVNSLLAFKAQRYFSSLAPQTSFGGIKSCPNQEATPFPDTTAPLSLKRLIYPIDEPTTLSLHFIDKDVFEVAGIGKGRLSQPFTNQNYTFILSSQESDLTDREFTLFLSPLHLTVHKLQKAITIEADKTNKQLLKISSCHHNRALATEIVNGFMTEYVNYLKRQGPEKISHQLSYLSQREQEVLAKLKTLTKAQGVYAKHELESGNFTLLGDPKSTALLYQAACKTYSDLSLRIQSTYESLFGIQRPTVEVVKETAKWIAKEPELLTKANLLTSDTGPALLTSMNHQVEAFELKFKNYDNLCQLLDQDDFELYALNETVAELLLDGETTRLSRFAAGANHTSKERAFAIEQMKTEKLLIKERLTHLTQLQQKEVFSIRERMHAVQRELLVALVKELKIIEEDVAHYLIRCGDHVDQVLFEHNVFLNKEILGKFQGELLALAEAKNLSYNLESQQIKPFEWAKQPYLPEPPKLKKFGVISIFLGLFFAFAIVALREIYFGPTASKTNLKALGKRVVDADEATFELLQGADSVALIGKQPLFANTLAKKMTLAGKKTLLFLLSGKEKSCLEKLVIRKEKAWDSLELGKIEDLALLQGDLFAKLLNSLKEEYDSILFVAELPMKRIAAALAKRVIYCVTDERISVLEGLDDSTLYLHEEEEVPQKKSLKDLIRSSSFSLERSHSS